MAAHEVKLEASGRALAKAHGIVAGAFDQAVEAVRKVGFHGEEAIHTIDRMIVADLDLSKAQGLAKIAKDAAAIENIGAGEALEKIVQAIEFGNARALRAAGLRVDFEREIQIRELQLGRTLSDNEKVQIRYNAVVQAAAAIQGAAAGAAGTAEAQMKALGREVTELREAVGAEFQDQFRWLVGTFRDLVKWSKDNTDMLAKFGQVAIYVAGVLTTYALAGKIMALAKSIAALNLASMNPYALLATGVLAAGAIVYTNWKGTQEQLEGRARDQERAALRRDVLSGKTKLEDLRKSGYTDDQVRELISGGRSLPGEEAFDFGGPKIAVGRGGKADLDALKLAAEIRKRQAAIERESREAALAAGAKGQLGFAKDLAEMNAQVAKWATFTDDKGQQHQIGLTRDAWVNVIDQLERRWGTFKRNLLKDNREHIAEYLKTEAEAAERRMEFEAQVSQRRLQNEEQRATKAMEHAQQVYAFEEQRAGYERDARTRLLDSYDAQTLQQKVWVEQQKLQIEVDYLERVHEIKMRLFDMETSRMVLEEEANLRRLGYRADEISARIGELTVQRDQIRQQQQETTDAAVQAARENASHRQAQLISAHNRQVFESFKRQADGVFDALLTKSQSVWSAIGNSLKTALLTAIKDVVTSRVAAMLMQLFMGTKVAFQNGSGVLGGLGVGAVPVFGAGSIMGGPGGTSGFAGPVGGRSGSLLSGGGLAGLLPGLQSFFGIGGSVATGAGTATTWGAATLGQKLDRAIAGRGGAGHGG